MSKLTRRQFGKYFFSGIAGTAFISSGIDVKSTAAQSIPRNPNIVFICSDQHAYKYTGYMGHPIVQTPNLDRIAAQGTVFTDAYAGAPVCVPGRSCLMTGTFASDNNSYGNSTVWQGQNPTWGSLIRDAGYYTWANGKMDLHDEYDLGFDYENTGNGHQRSPDITELFRRPLAYRVNERPNVDGGPRNERHQDSDRTMEALDFLQNEAGGKSKPWAMYIGMTEPHPRFVALKKYFDYYYPNKTDMPNIPPDHLENLHVVFKELRHFKHIATPISDDRIRRARAGYYGLIGEMDEYIGQIYDALEKSGELENTIFIYTSDHGESLGEHGLWYKNNLYDVGIRVPLVVAGAGIPEGRVIDKPVSHVDLIKSMLEWTGASNRPTLRGTSLIPLIQGEDHASPEFVYAENHSEGNVTGSFMIRKGDWKYIHFTWYDDLLFNLKEDPGEFENRIEDPEAAAILKELKTHLNETVNPEEITIAAFDAEDTFRTDMANRMTEEELFQEFRGRLGDGLARNMAKMLKQS